MPNPLCECDGVGWCKRHQIDKASRHFELCAGIANTVDCGRKYWIGWEKGSLGNTAPENPITSPPTFCGGPAPPNLARRAANFAKAAVGHAADGFKKVSDEEFQYRLLVCAGDDTEAHPKCESLSDAGVCTEKQCGCVVFKKAAWKSESCPIGKWQGFEEPVETTEQPVEPCTMKWSYGITTVEQRKDILFPRTLQSLKDAGFDKPIIFVDGLKDGSEYNEFGLEVVTRYVEDAVAGHYHRIRTFGNWVLALWELYLREPTADRYAIFQDDFVTYKHLRLFLEKSPYPDKGYLNLYTFPSNQKVARDKSGWFLSNQKGRGAVALVFSREAVTTLLASQHMVDRPQDAQRGWKAIDGGIVTAFVKADWQEWCHNPSLVQHTGEQSVMKNRQHLKAVSFRGEDFDARNLLT